MFLCGAPDFVDSMIPLPSMLAWRGREWVFKESPLAVKQEGSLIINQCFKN